MTYFLHIIQNKPFTISLTFDGM